MHANRPTRGDKDEVRREMHLTRPPRLEGKVKNIGIRMVKKQEHDLPPKRPVRKQQSYSARQRKNYHLKSKKH